MQKIDFMERRSSRQVCKKAGKTKMRVRKQRSYSKGETDGREAASKNEAECR